MANTEVGKQILVISGRTAKILFGDAPENLLQKDAVLFKLRTMAVSRALRHATIATTKKFYARIRTDRVWETPKVELA